MKQTVNLYLPEFRKRQEWLDAKRMALLFLLTAGLLAVASGIEFWRNASMGRELAGVQQQHKDLVAATEKLRASFGSQVPDAALQNQVKQLEDALKSKQAILQFMGGKDLGNTSGFSEYLADLSRNYRQGLSLSEIKLTDGGKSVTLSGEVIKADVVPLYLQNLSNGRSYAGKNFRTLQINQGKAKPEQAGAAVHPQAWLFTVSTDK